MRDLQTISIALSLGVAAWFAPPGARGESVINTIAGGGPDHIPALSANLYRPWSVAVNSAGELFVTAGHRVFKVDGFGQLTIVAGNNSSGFSGDGGLAKDASLDSPIGIAFDADDNLFIADGGNNRIRRIDSISRIISTVAGNGSGSFSGDGGPAESASLWNPQAIALDAAGNLYIADSGNGRIRRVDATTGIISTVAGNGCVVDFDVWSCPTGDGGPAISVNLRYPHDIALDAAGNLFIATNLAIRHVDAASGIITTIAGGGSSGADGIPATDAFVGTWLHVALGEGGDLFIADRERQRVRVVDETTGIITTVAGSGNIGFGGDGGPATSALFRAPSGIALNAAGDLFLADTDNLRVRRVDAATGIISTIAGNGTCCFSGDGAAGISASLLVAAVALDPAGNLLIADAGNGRIRRLDAASGIITTYAGSGDIRFNGDRRVATVASLWNPKGIAVDAAGDLFIADQGHNRIRRVDASTGILTTFAGSAEMGFGGDGGAATDARLAKPSGVALDAAGNVFFADTENARIRRVDGATGIISTVAGSDDVGFGGDGDVATSARLNHPVGIAVDAHGNLFIADERNHRIRRVDAETDVITTVAGGGVDGASGDGGVATSARLVLPSWVALDSDANLFIADSGSARIRRVDAATGVITTVAGNGSAGFSGDGGEAITAMLNGPRGITLASDGALFIADTGNARIRKVGAEFPAIAIDIKPGGTPNSINPSDRGVIPVAILGSEDFDVSEIDAASLSFAAGGALPAHDLGDPTVLAGHLADVNGDGITDLVSHYWTEESGIVHGDMTACLSGSTFDGLQLSGCDAVRTVPDMDGDQLLDTDESAAGTNAFFRDSDGDGYDDGVEVLTMGTDPLDALDPAPAPVEPKKPSRLRNRRR